MKKILACLLVVALLLSLTVVFVGCNSKELKNLSYINENGEVVTVSVKKTDDPELVTQSILALASKDVSTSDLESILFALNVGGSVTGTQKEQAFDLNLAANATIGLAVPTSIDGKKLSEIIKASKLYLGASVTGKLPTDIMNIADEEAPFPNFTNTFDVNESLAAYLDGGDLYLKGNVSEGLIAAFPQFADLLNGINGKTGKANSLLLNSLYQLLDYMVPQEDIAEYLAIVRNDSNSYNKASDKIEEEIDKKSGEETPEDDFSFKYDDVKAIVDAFNIRITKTKGSVATFAMTINNDSIKKLNAYFNTDDDKETDLDEDFVGQIDIEFALDAKTMLDCSISITATSIFEYMLDDVPAEEQFAITGSQIYLNAAINTQAEIPTISQEDKDAAEVVDLPIQDLMGLIMK